MRWLLPMVLAGLAVLAASATPKFATPSNLTNVLTQAASGAIVAAGLTVVLAVGGVDLAVGSVMFLGATTCGGLLAAGAPAWIAVAAMLAVGPAAGVVHGTLVAAAGMSPFIVTLASLFACRGLGLWISQTRASNLPATLTDPFASAPLGVPAVVWVAAMTLFVLNYVMKSTPFGRHVHAVGHDAEAARKAGVPVGRIRVGAYAIAGGCATLGGLVALAQLGAVSPTFGRDRELDAIAAAVLGGASLFGGRGSVLPGALAGAVGLAIIFNVLNLLNANPYSYSMLTGAVILLAAAVDAARRGRVKS